MSDPQTLGQLFDAAVEQYRSQAGKASAMKRGRNPVFPYVSVIIHTHSIGVIVKSRQEQVRGRAYVTNADAIIEAQRIIDARVSWFDAMIKRRGSRAIREQYGLPREFPVEWVKE